MLSKLLWPSCRPVKLLAVRGPQKQCRRKILGLIPPTQYDVPFPNKLKLGNIIKEHWEIIPLILTTCVSLGFMFASIIWACKNKVDVVFSTRNRHNISRTMDLRNPSVHKIILINQRYEPWPEMQDALDKVAAAEKRALVRMQTCNVNN